MLGFLNLPGAGFCEIAELLTAPAILIGNRQLPPDGTLKWPVEFSPQSDIVIDVGQSEAARAKDTDTELAAPTISTKAATLDNRIINFLVFMQNHTDQGFLRRS